MKKKKTIWKIGIEWSLNVLFLTTYKVNINRPKKCMYFGRVGLQPSILTFMSFLVVGSGLLLCYSSFCHQMDWEFNFMIVKDIFVTIT